ncbi:thermonuclease family protein (plasmid) [Agrobacterium leguminum]|uniref:thermonuclease family protein n=1 Tax=Agrobacterium leguminum TaxID=2792015 RepID=UPI0030CAE458
MKYSAKIICETFPCLSKPIDPARFRHIGLSASLAALLSLLPSVEANASQWPICGAERRIACVVDGDTFWHDRVKYRIADIDAPESGERAQCEDERILAGLATQRLKELLDSGGVQLRSLNREDRYGRVLVRVLTNSGDVSPLMISEGLAAPFGKPDRGRMVPTIEMRRSILPTPHASASLHLLASSI